MGLCTKSEMHHEANEGRLSAYPATGQRRALVLEGSAGRRPLPAPEPGDLAMIWYWAL